MIDQSTPVEFERDDALQSRSPDKETDPLWQSFSCSSSTFSWMLGLFTSESVWNRWKEHCYNFVIFDAQHFCVIKMESTDLVQKLKQQFKCFHLQNNQRLNCKDSYFYSALTIHLYSCVCFRKLKSNAI